MHVRDLALSIYRLWILFVSEKIYKCLYMHNQYLAILIAMETYVYKCHIL